jgi:hypothetical protein
MATVAHDVHDTNACPAPESGEHAIVQIEVAPGGAPQAPRYVQSVVDDLRGILAGLRCPDHDTAPAVTVAFGTDDDATVSVVLHDCCQQLDELMVAALRHSPIFRVMRVS